MLSDLTILAADEFDARTLFYVAVVVIAIIGGMINKAKQAAQEADRRRRLSSPTPQSPANRVPPVPQQPPTANPWPPVVAQTPVPQRRQVPRPRSRAELEAEKQRQARRQRVLIETEPSVQAAKAPRPERQLGGGVQQALGNLEQQVEGEFRGLAGAMPPVQSLAQLRAGKQKPTAAGADPVAFRKPTMTELRRAIILNEILGPPLAEREGV